MSKRRIIITVVLLVVIFVALNFQDSLFRVTNFFSPSYEKDFYQKNYQVEGDKIYLLDQKTNQRYPIKQTFSDDFENAANIRDLISIERGWTSFTLQSPQSATVTDYNKLQERILKGESGFLDNRVEPSTEQTHSGKQSLKTLAVAPASYTTCTKASLSTMLLHFRKRNDVWFSAWYYLQKVSTWNTLMDLESTFVRGRPGMRICLHKGHLQFELAKWSPKQMYRQDAKSEIIFPAKQWVHVQFHLRLSDENDGVIQLWQDGKLIIDEHGQNLPFAEAVYNNLEIGLSAHSESSDSAVLYVDDMAISLNPI
jgi:hypothetical protein